MLAGAILAGGKSSRMGTDKSLLTLPDNQLSLLEHVKKTLALVCNNNIFISGSKHEKGIADRIPNCGPLSGIHGVITHIELLQPNTRELLVVAVDMPDLLTQDLTHLLKVGRDNQSLCCYENCFLPIYIPLSTQLTDYLESVLTQQSDKSGKPRQFAIKTMFESFQGIQIPPLKHTQLNNINTLEQWQQHCVKHTFSKATK